LVPRAGLGNLLQRLSSEPCRIAYLGASVTAQKEGYRPFLQKWFVDRFRQPHQEINAGFGGVGSISGVFMMDQQVLGQDPDFCLIEYASGDMSGQTPQDELGPVVEGMVRKLISANCAVAFLYLYRTDEDFADTNRVIAVYERVATHYRVPSINVGRVIQESIAAGTLALDAFVRDKVHTTLEGSRTTADYISRALESVLAMPEAEDRPVLPSRLFPRSYQRTEIIPATPAMLRHPESGVSGKFRFTYDYVQVNDSNEIRFTPAGELTGFLVIVGKDAGIISVETNDSSNEYTLWDEWCQYNRLTTVILREPICSGAKVTIRLTNKAVDYPESHRASLTTPNSPRRFTLVGFFVRDTSADKVE
jgi:acyl-CoA thioesterase I